MESINKSKYKNLSIEKRKELLKDILNNIKEYKNSRIELPVNNILLSEEMYSLFRDIYDNIELVKRDSGIILSNIKLVENNLEDEQNIKNLDSQRKLLTLIYYMNLCFLVPMFNLETTTMPYDTNDVITLKCIDIAGIKVDEHSIITKEAVNESIIDKHNVILKLDKDIRARNL